MKRILEVKKQIGTLSKNAKNPFFKSQYLDLNDLLNSVEPLLHEQGLILLQPLRDNKVWSQIIDGESGTVIADSYLDLPIITDPQKIGSCITYFRRYTLKSLLSISEVDDDGNKASTPEPVRKLKPTVKQLDSAKAKLKAGEPDVINKMKSIFDIDENQIEYIKDGTN
jgi:hypothetical protein